MKSSQSGGAPARGRALRDHLTAVYRHPLPVRIWHWLNVLCLMVLIPSGLQILNAHPALYWGNVSSFHSPWLVIGSEGDAPAFPSWITLPPWRDLGDGRSWHFFFAWIFVAIGSAYGIYVLVSGRMRRMLLPARGELRHLGRSICDHLRLHFPESEQAHGYNLLQKLSYLVVLFILLPLVALTGLTMSPGIDARLPFLPVLFGGRQSARTLHFLIACTLVLFLTVHLAAMLAAGPVTELRSMLTGWYLLRRGDGQRPQ